MKILRIVALVIVAGTALTCKKPEDNTPTTPAPNPNATWRMVETFQNLTFNAPVEMIHAADGSNRLFVLEQRGVVRVFRNEASIAQTEVFLDISSRVTSGGETGLLGMAFHPNFSTNGQIFVHYTRRNNGQLQSVISRFSTNRTIADPNSEQVILAYNQPFANHNAGSILFGRDGFLYITTGDGGSGGDPQNNSQNLGNLLGKILRIDVNRTENGLPYSIPADNPFRNNSNARPEIFAYGLRNPWKMTADRANGRMWIADVGQNTREEIDILERGGNFGWRVVEGRECFNPANNCNRTGFVEPVLDYGTSEGRSITGGYVYRGKKLPNLVGRYVYGDYVSGNIWALDYNETSRQATNTYLARLIGALSSFGEDESGELYLLNYQSGKIHTLEFR
ncbi:MAG: PQQ-dependent sugar dehydrogenase [Runella sp.]